MKRSLKGKEFLLFILLIIISSCNKEDHNNEPQIDDQTFTIEENAPNQSFVGKVIATDSKNQTLTYSIISGNFHNTFGINSWDGEIFVNDSSYLDFETIQSFNLEVKVTDDGENLLSSTANITIHLSDMTIPMKGMVAYYPFNGDINDKTDNNYDGESYGTVLTQDRYGKPNSAIYFDGINDFIDLSIFANTFKSEISNLSISFHVSFSGTINSQYQTILSLGDKGEDIYTNVHEIELENNQIQVETETGQGFNHEYRMDDPPIDNKWMHYVFIFNGNMISFFKDGKLITKCAYTPAESKSNKFYIGGFGCKSNTQNCFFNGKLDDIVIYNRILTESEIQILNIE